MILSITDILRAPQNIRFWSGFFKYKIVKLMFMNQSLKSQIKTAAETVQINNIYVKEKKCANAQKIENILKREKSPIKINTQYDSIKGQSSNTAE